MADELFILGDRVLKEREYGDEVQQDVADRTADIVCLGLEEKEVNDLLEVLIPPKNCKIIDPPKVNIEAMFRDASTKERDKRIVRNQMKESAVLSALQQALTILLAQGPNFEKIFEIVIQDHNLHETLKKMNEERKILLNLITNANRLSADLQHEMSMCRRGICLGNVLELSEFVREQVRTECKINEYLFGANMGEVIKAAKSREPHNARPQGPKINYRSTKNGRAPQKAGNLKYSPRPNKHTMSAPKQNNHGFNRSGGRKDCGHYRNSKK